MSLLFRLRYEPPYLLGLFIDSLLHGHFLLQTWWLLKEPFFLVVGFDLFSSHESGR